MKISALSIVYTLIYSVMTGLLKEVLPFWYAADVSLIIAGILTYIIGLIIKAVKKSKIKR